MNNQTNLDLDGSFNQNPSYATDRPTITDSQNDEATSDCEVILSHDRNAPAASSDNKPSVSVPFTEEHMVELLLAYNSYEEMQELLEKLIGPCLFQGGIFEGLDHLDQLLIKLSPLYKKNVDYEAQEFCYIMEDKEIGLHEKARILLSGKKS